MQRGRFVPAAHGNMRWNHNSVYYHELVADAAEGGELGARKGARRRQFPAPAFVRVFSICHTLHFSEE